MQLRRVFAEDIVENKVVLSEEESHYLVKVLRLNEGNNVEVITKNGSLKGRVLAIEKRRVVVSVEGKPEIKNEPETKIALFQAMPEKIEKLELIVQKLTELGVREIHTFHSRYTNPKYRKMDLTKKFDRLNKIAKEAVRQCKRTFPPKIFKPVSFKDALKKAEGFDNRICFGERGKTLKSEVKSGSFAFFIGAEGGFTEEEFSLFVENGFYFVNLGNRILRTETAAIAGMTIIQACFGDFKNLL